MTKEQRWLIIKNGAASYRWKVPRFCATLNLMVTMVIFNTTLVGITLGRIKTATIPCIAAQVELNRHLIENNYILSAPFAKIMRVFRLGKNYSPPDIMPFRKKTEFLDTAIEVPLVDVTNKTFETAYSIMRKAAIQTLLAVASKYSLPSQFLTDLDLTPYPNNLYEETLEYERKCIQQYNDWIASKKGL